MQLFAITGLRGTGIAAVSRLLTVLGVDMGSSEELGSPSVDPSSSELEHQGFTAIADEMLEVVWGADWSQPPALPLGFERAIELQDFRRRAAHLVRDAFAPQAEFAAWADTRSALLLPFWRTAASVDAEIVTIRDPLESSAALLMSDGLAYEHGAELWVRYTVAALCNSHRPLLVHHDALTGDLDGTLNMLASHLGLGVSDAQRQRARESAVPNIVPPEAPPTDPGSHLTLAKGLYELLCAHGWAGPVPAIANRLHDNWRQIAAEEARRSASEAAREAAHRDLTASRTRQQIVVEELGNLTGELAYERRIRQETEVTRDQLESELATLRFEIRRGEDEARQLRGHRRSTPGPVVDDRVRKAEAREQSARQDLQRLRSRRSVRLALGASAPFRPIFRGWRRISKRLGPDRGG